MSRKVFKGIKIASEDTFSGETGYMYLVQRNNESGYIHMDGEDFGVGTYSKPVNGIPKEDMTQIVQASLEKAENSSMSLYYLVELNYDGSVKVAASTLTYEKVQEDLTNPRKEVYLDVIWENGLNPDEYMRFYVPCVGISEVNNGVIYFVGSIYRIGNGNVMTFIFQLDNQNVLTTLALMSTQESCINKVQSVVSSSANTVHYPSTKAVFDEFQRKPVVVWETDGTSGLTALNTDLTDSPTWQLTGLDFSPFKRVKIYTKANKKSSGVGVDASTTPAFVMEMLLDSRAAGPYAGGAFIASNVIQKINDSNRFATLTCVISADKTSFSVYRMTNIYGTAATDNNDVNGFVFLIEGYYD